MTTTQTREAAHRRDPEPWVSQMLDALPDTPPEKGERRRTLIVGAVVLLLVALAIGGVYLLSTRGSATEDRAEVAEVQRDETAEQAVDISQQVLDECAAGRLAGQICDAARGVVSQPIPPIPGPGPTTEEIRAAVADELAANPPPSGRAPTTAEIAAIVADYLIANPPQPGRPPTAVEIAAAVGVYFATNPVQSGEQGRPPTAEEIRVAVAAELAANPPPRGAMGNDGDQGDQGVGVQEVRTEQRDSGCVLVFVLVNPSDGSTAEQAVPVSDRVCSDGGLLGP